MKVVVLYGGKSGEHEIALESASHIVRGLVKDHDVSLVAITKKGRWFLQGKTELERILSEKNSSLRIDESEENGLEKEFSIIKDENGFLKVKKVSLIPDANIRLILINKKLRKYKLVILPKKDIPDACVRISLSGEQSNLRARIRNAYENDNVLNPLRINQDKIYMNNLFENQKFTLSFILNYSDDCSMEVELYEYRV